VPNTHPRKARPVRAGTARPAAAVLAGLFVAACQAGVAVGTFTTETYVTIGDDGAGTIDSTTRYDATTLSAALPEAEIRRVRTAVEDRTVSTLAAFEDGVQVVQFYRGPDGTVDEIHGVTHRLRGPNGERIGMSMAEAGITRADCRAGRNLWRGMAVCPARNARNVTLVFAIPGYRGPFDALPSEEDLRRAELQRIIWRA
jgi:hypothetical protein